MSNLWAPAPPALTGLGRYRVLSPNAGILVSPLQLGAMSIGDKWAGAGMGAMDKQSSFELLDAYYNDGGNFIDTANNYQNESSEEFIGEWAEQRGIRDQLVIATKYPTNYKRGDASITQKISYTGNHIKSMHISVEASLKKLRTSYIDILASPTLLHGLSPKLTSTRDHGKTPFVIYQGAWNVMHRDLEREIIPMARSEGLALAPWNVLAGGKLRSDAEEERRAASGENGRTLINPDWKRNEEERKMSLALEKIASEVGTESITAIAIAYLLHKRPYVFPIVGGRKLEHLRANTEAFDITLSPAQIATLESVFSFNPGFHDTMIGDGHAVSRFLLSAGEVAAQPLLQSITAKGKI